MRNKENEPKKPARGSRGGAFNGEREREQEEKLRGANERACAAETTRMGINCFVSRWDLLSHLTRPRLLRMNATRDGFVSTAATKRKEKQNYEALPMPFK